VSDGIAERVYKIEGMDCGGCAATVSKAVEGLPGVVSAQVVLARETLTVGLSLMCKGSPV
jgi:copper chaperone CopZ